MWRINFSFPSVWAGLSRLSVSVLRGQSECCHWRAAAVWSGFGSVRVRFDMVRFKCEPVKTHHGSFGRQQLA